MRTLLTKLEDLVFSPTPLRVRLGRYAVRKSGYGSFAYRSSIDAVDYPPYAYGLLEAARLAQGLGLTAISAVELGVAGGRGLLALERHAHEVGQDLGVDIEVYGFDSGAGLPASDDLRDLPYRWRAGAFAMDQDELRHRLQSAVLVLGDVNTTCTTFFEDHDPAPIGCVFVDLDYYTSTLAALQLFEAPSSTHLPRVVCYLDDIRGTTEFIGELATVEEFNARNPEVKIGRSELLSTLRRCPMPWNDQIFEVHDFAHPRYRECLRDPPGLGLADR